MNYAKIIQLIKPVDISEVDFEELERQLGITIDERTREAVEKSDSLRKGIAFRKYFKLLSRP